MLKQHLYSNRAAAEYARSKLLHPEQWVTVPTPRGHVKLIKIVMVKRKQQEKDDESKNKLTDANR